MKRVTRNILLFIVFILFLALVGTYIYGQITYSTEFAQNWENIKDDFETINGLAIECFEKNNYKTINAYEFKKTLNNEQLASFERAENNYQKYGDYGGKITTIQYHDGIIEYYDWERYGQFEKIVYTKHTRRELNKIYNKGERHYVIEKLGDNWYYLDEHHL